MPASQGPKSLEEVLELRRENLRPEHLGLLPRMTGWFSPKLLAKLLWQVILSDIFGQYADRRLIHAALDKQEPDDRRECMDLRRLLAEEDGSVWFDYVADLGDGFDATYAIAYLLAQPELDVGGHRLPRPRCLVMGGDQVYPTASTT